jgi:predicted small secreted protein
LTNRKKAFDTNKIISSSWVVFSNKPTNCSKFMHTHTSQAGITTIINGKTTTEKT